jgi:arabinogalactan endo-1,4-beta-galactosidase
MKRIFTILNIALIFSMGLVPAWAQVFYKGSDLSYVNEIEACAGQIYKENNVQKDIYAILADNGANIARFRLWHTRDNGWSTYPDVKNAIIRAKAKGMAVILDFHYSDDWADPGTQCTPAAWLAVDNNYQAIADSLYNYTYQILDDLKRSGLTPEFVQVGNETNGGMCYAGCAVAWPNPWAKQTLLYNAGISACRTIDPAIQIILHESNPVNAEWWMSELYANNVTDFDVVGISHYPCWHNDDIEGLQSVIVNIRNQYNKDVMVVETAVPWTDGWVDNQNNAQGCVPERYKTNPKTKPSPEIASRWCVDLADAIYASGGIGLVYWGGEWVATNIPNCPTFSYPGGTVEGGSTWENSALFDFNFNLLDPGPIDFIQKSYGATSGGVPANFNLIYPYGAVGQKTLTYDWEDASGATEYTLLVADNIGFINPVINVSNLTTSTYTGGVLSPYKTYYWKVIATNSYGSTKNTGDWSFTTKSRLKSAEVETSIQTLDNTFTIYPNPVNSNFITINFNEVPNNYKARIVNVNGAIVREYRLTGNKEQNLDLQNVEKGVYIINIISVNGSINQRIIVK